MKIRTVSIIQALILGAVLVLSGCALFSGKKLEAGGAYAQTATSAAMPELYLTDAGVDATYSALKAVFDYEKANRITLWRLSPNIKHELDQLRDQTWQVTVTYATARTAYLANPTPANLGALRTIAGKLNQINAAATAVITPKTTNP